MEDNHNPIRELSLTEPCELIKLINKPERYISDVRRAYIITLNKYGWNQKKAAEALGIPRSTFRDQMVRYRVLEHSNQHADN